ncbi:MAG: Na+/H+ antiporter subunit E [Spirochaetales bacterium]|nr:Na+/H+ antiporter subunit E [Spirochaetales bacterium]
MRRLLGRGVILFIFWILLTASLNGQELVLGAVLALLASWVSLKIAPQDPGERLSFRNWLLYVPTLFIEIVLANISIARLVLSPKININPGIVKIPTKLKSDRKKWFLAQAITLTPGTVTLDILDDYLLVHWIDIEGSDSEEQGRIIKEKFEKAME